MERNATKPGRSFGTLAAGGALVLGALWLALNLSKDRDDGTTVVAGAEEDRLKTATPEDESPPGTRGQTRLGDTGRVPLESSRSPTKTPRVVTIRTFRSDIVGPVPHAIVSLRPLRSDPVDDKGRIRFRSLLSALAGSLPIQATTNGGGLAQVSIEQGKLYLVQAKAEGLMTLGFPSVLREGTPQVSIPFTKSLRLEGLVLSPEGNGLSGAKLSFCSAELRSGQAGFVTSAGFTTTKADGSFLLDTEEQLTGDVFVSVSHPNYAPLVEKLPKGRASSYLTLRMRRGLQFRIRVLDTLGRPVGKARLTLTQGRYTVVLDGPPVGPELGGSLMGLKTFPLLRVSPTTGSVLIRGWPRGVPAWLSCGVSTRGAQILPGFDVKQSPHKIPLPSTFEFVPLDRQTYTLYVNVEQKRTVLISGRANDLTVVQKRDLRFRMMYGKGHMVPIKVTWDGDLYTGIASYSAKVLLKRVESNSSKRDFKIVVRRSSAQKGQEFGPFPLDSDLRLRGMVLLKRQIF